MKDNSQKNKQNIYNSNRKIGVEIEYIGVNLLDTAKMLQSLFQGRILRKHKNLYQLINSDIGEFRIEVDIRLLKELASESQKNLEQDKVDLHGKAEKLLSLLLEKFSPNEIVTPPVSLSKINLFDKIIEALRKSGAHGTQKSLLTAFGLHLNPDVPSLKADILLAYIQSYCILSDWLRSEIQVDFTRVASTFVNEFPIAYQQLILQPNYKPNIISLIDDYLNYNRTRNRALDMLPVFSYIDKDRVHSKIKSKLIKARPTFHYRLPNCRLDKKNWNISTEWERWLYIEKLAINQIIRKQMLEEYLSLIDEGPFTLKVEWVTQTKKYLKKI